MMDESEAGKKGNCGEPVVECCENSQQKCLISVTSITEIKENCNTLQLSDNSKQKEQSEGQAFIKGTNKPKCPTKCSSGFCHVSSGFRISYQGEKRAITSSHRLIPWLLLAALFPGIEGREP